MSRWWDSVATGNELKEREIVFYFLDRNETQQLAIGKTAISQSLAEADAQN